MDSSVNLSRTFHQLLDRIAGPRVLFVFSGLLPKFLFYVGTSPSLRSLAVVLTLQNQRSCRARISIKG